MNEKRQGADGAPKIMAVLDRWQKVTDIKKALIADFESHVDDTSAATDRARIFEHWVASKLAELQMQLLESATSAASPSE